MPARADISDHLVHFTSDSNERLAFERFRSIIADQCLFGGDGKIRGATRCVCFTEAPLASLERGLVNPSVYSRYSPFGIMFEKSWVYAYGGRPVIYQSEAEFDGLPDGLKWRHVRYEPGLVDFTWEREWRMRTDELHFTPNDACLVVPDDDWAEELVDRHNADEDVRVLQYSTVMDEFIAEQYREDFPWRICVLR
jgi:hypothetical protein